MESSTLETASAGKFSLPKLPFFKDAMAPVISAEAISLHHDKHHRKYVDTTNELLQQHPMPGDTLEEVVRGSSGKLFNNAAQAWNHDFYWHSLTPDGKRPSLAFMRQIDKDFGGYDQFRHAFATAGADQFGSGWVWLVKNAGRLEIMATSDADTPMAHGLRCLLTLDVWEHAYYVDYRNEREKYLAAVIATRLNWEFAEGNFQ